MDKELEALIANWQVQKAILSGIQPIYIISVENLSQLNTKIYLKCKELGIKIETLNL